MFFDIGVGMLIATFVGVLVGTETPTKFLAVGLIGALWPDFDFLWYVARRWARGMRPLVDRWSTNHRDLLHRPLALTPLTTVIVEFIFGPPEALLFGCATIAHFVHDTIAHGWGIRWFWPFGSRFYVYRTVGSLPPRFYHWTREEQVAVVSRHGRDRWLKQSYGRLSPELRIELAVFACGLTTVTAWYIWA